MKEGKEDEEDRVGGIGRSGAEASLSDEDEASKVEDPGPPITTNNTNSKEEEAPQVSGIGSEGSEASLTVEVEDSRAAGPDPPITTNQNTGNEEANLTYNTR